MRWTWCSSVYLRFCCCLCIYICVFFFFLLYFSCAHGFAPLRMSRSCALPLHKVVVFQMTRLGRAGISDRVGWEIRCRLRSDAAAKLAGLYALCMESCPREVSTRMFILQLAFTLLCCKAFAQNSSVRILYSHVQYSAPPTNKAPSQLFLSLAQTRGRPPCFLVETLIIETMKKPKQRKSPMKNVFPSGSHIFHLRQSDLPFSYRLHSHTYSPPPRHLPTFHSRIARPPKTLRVSGARRHPLR